MTNEQKTAITKLLASIKNHFGNNIPENISNDMLNLLFSMEDTYMTNSWEDSWD